MYACMYIYIYTYIHIYTYTYIHIYIHTLHYITLHYITLHYITLQYNTLQYIHTYIHIYIYIYITACIYAYPHICNITTGVRHNMSSPTAPFLSLRHTARRARRHWFGRPCSSSWTASRSSSRPAPISTLRRATCGCGWSMVICCRWSMV